MSDYQYASFDSSDGLVPSDNKPLLESTLTYSVIRVNVKDRQKQTDTSFQHNPVLVYSIANWYLLKVSAKSNIPDDTTHLYNTAWFISDWTLGGYNIPAVVMI